MSTGSWQIIEPKNIVESVRLLAKMFVLALKLLWLSYPLINDGIFGG
jgi:hypothetical protein